MKVIEGRFDSKKEVTKASDMFAVLYEAAKEAEEQEQAEIKSVVVMWAAGQPVEVVSNEQYPDAAFMLLHMASHGILEETFGG